MIIFRFVSNIIDFNFAIYGQKIHRWKCLHIKLLPNSWWRKKSLHTYVGAGEKNNDLP